MRQNPPRRDWFFPIEEASVLATVTHMGVVRDVRVSHKKALIAADTGDIVGIVGAGYKVFTNQKAVTLCHKFCLEAFPDTTPGEWTRRRPVRRDHPRTRPNAGPPGHRLAADAGKAEHVGARRTSET